MYEYESNNLPFSFSFKTDCLDPISEIQKIIPIGLRFFTVFSEIITVKNLEILEFDRVIRINFGLTIDIYIEVNKLKDGKYNISIKKNRNAFEGNINDLNSVDGVKDYIEYYFKKNFFYKSYSEIYLNKEKHLNPAKIDWSFQYNFNRLFKYYYKFFKKKSILLMLKYIPRSELYNFLYNFISDDLNPIESYKYSPSYNYKKHFE